MSYLQVFDDFLRGPNDWRKKLAAVLVLGLMLGFTIGAKVWSKSEDLSFLFVVASGPVVAAVLALLASPYLIADSVAQQMKAGRQFGPLVRIFFGPSEASKGLRFAIVVLIPMLPLIVWIWRELHR